MNAVSFDFLNIVADVSVDNSEVYFELKNSSTSIEKCSLKASITPKVKQLCVEVNYTDDPQQSFDKDIDCFYVDQESIALVDYFENVYAVQDMPFVLTGSQVNTINSFLEDIAQEEMK